MKKVLNNILYGVTYIMFYALSLLPFRALYIISDFMYILIYMLVGYRKKVVRKNIATSFPEKGSKELACIERRFYRWFCDYFVETIKLLSISPQQMSRHIEFRNVEELEQCFDNGQSCAAILGHYCNWEWLSGVGIAYTRHKDAVSGLIYHPLYSDVFNRLFISLRSHLGGVCIPKNEILRYLLRYRQEKRHSLFGYISDQVPKWENIHLWLDFLNHDTPVFTGGERIMKKMNDAVFYVDMERTRRGHYVCTFRLITKEPDSLPKYEITRTFFRMLEQSVRRDPSCYLWTHNRWKRTHEEYDSRVARGEIKIRT